MVKDGLEDERKVSGGRKDEKKQAGRGVVANEKIDEVRGLCNSFCAVLKALSVTALFVNLLFNVL